MLFDYFYIFQYIIEVLNFFFLIDSLYFMYKIYKNIYIYKYIRDLNLKVKYETFNLCYRGSNPLDLI